MAPSITRRRSGKGRTCWHKERCPDAGMLQPTTPDGLLFDEGGVRQADHNVLPISLFRRKALICAMLLIAMVLPMWCSFEKPALAMDEGALLVYPEQILNGKLPYRDFETFYGPANPLVLSAVYFAAGPDVIVERAVGLAYRVVILLSIFLLVQRWSLILAATATGLAGFLMMPTALGAFAWVGAVAAVLSSLYLATAVESSRRVFWAGSLAGIALLFRPDFAPAVFISALPLTLLMKWSIRWKYVMGVAVGLFPYAVITLFAGPTQVLNNLFLYPVLYSSPGRRLPFFAADAYSIRLFFVHAFAAAINIVAGLVMTRRKPSDVSARLLLGLGLLGLGLTHQAVQRLDAGHAIPAALVSISVLPVSIFLLCHRLRWLGNNQWRAIVASAITVAALLTIVPNLGAIMRDQAFASLNGNARYSVFVQSGDRSFPVGAPRHALEISEIVDRINSLATNGQRLFVGPADLRRTNYNDTFFYYLLPALQPATYFLEMNPLSANRPDSRLASDVGSADWLILCRQWDFWNEPNESSKFGSDAPMQVAREKFELCFETRAYALYRKRDLKAVAP